MTGRRSLIGALVALLVVAVAACGSGSTNSASRTVTIGHSMGKTSVQGVPTRIVALGTQWLDVVEALGVTPVGYIDSVAAVNGGNPAPWEPAALSTATAIDPKGDLAAQVRELQPDLILAGGYVTNREVFDTLTEIAPTIPNLTAAQVESWSNQLSVLGKVLAEEGLAQSITANLNARLASLTVRYPALEGRSYVTLTMLGPAEVAVATDAKDPAGTLFTRLGMVVPPNLAVDVGPGRPVVPPDRAGDLAADLIVVTATSDMRALLQQTPGFADLPAVQRNAVAYLDPATGTGLSLPSPLSLPYVIDRLEPALANAAK